jgi:signal transduction histidine kinase
MSGAKTISIQLKSISELISIIIIIFGILILIGWAFNISILLSPGAGFSSIKSNVGPGFILIGLALYLVQDKRNNPRNKKISQILAFIVFLIGFLTLFEYLSGINLFIDEILFKEAPGAFLTSSPNRMAFSAAIGLTSAGLAALFIDYETKSGHRPGQYLMLILGSVAIMALLGFAYGVSYFYKLPSFTGIAIYAAIAFLILFLGFIFARPDKGFMHTFNSDLLGSKNAARILLPTILLTLIVGWLLVQGRNYGLYQGPFAVSLFALSTIILTFILTWQNTIVLNKTDLKIQKAHHELEKSRDNLELEVKKRTAELVELNKNLGKEISERKKYERILDQKLIELKRSNAELEQFAYIASHDLQEPLRMVSSYLQLIERRYADKLDEDGHEFMEFAVDGANRMQTMINDLLIYSRVTTRGKEFETINMDQILEKVLKNLEVSIDENNARVNYESLPEIKADPSQMSQIFQNLISNGIRFKKDENPVISISSDENEEEWIFTVEDNGIGIDPEYSEKIFEVFKRLHGKDQYPGTGIGLAISKKIAERHGGHIWVESELDKGSKFIFTISKNPED